MRSHHLLVALLFALPGLGYAEDSDDCAKARREANFASNTCAAAGVSCNSSCGPAREAAVNQCDSILSSERGWCEANDTAFLNPCYSQAGANHRGCMANARAISTCATSECSYKTEICAVAETRKLNATAVCTPNRGE